MKMIFIFIKIYVAKNIRFSYFCQGIILVFLNCISRIFSRYVFGFYVNMAIAGDKMEEQRKSQQSPKAVT